MISISSVELLQYRTCLHCSLHKQLRQLKSATQPALNRNPVVGYMITVPPGKVNGEW
jgi:hypothetical protein